jgi:redox-sensing transcriptional repressor
VKCYPLQRIKEEVKAHKISVAIVTVPAGSATEVKNLLVDAGIRGILNFTTIPLKVPDHVYLDEYDMITSLEKVAYFVKSVRN